MIKNFFEAIRPGINTTFQDLGRNNQYHIGIPFSGAMDNRNFILANAIAGNKENTPVIEFAYQGPLLKFKGEKINFNITGNVSFNLIKKEGPIKGNCYENYTLKDGDQLDIISTNKSVYGYLAISGNFDVKFQWGSCSTNTKANVGANDGKKIDKDQLIKILNTHSHDSKRKLEYINSKIENKVQVTSCLCFYILCSLFQSSRHYHLHSILLASNDIHNILDHSLLHHHQMRHQFCTYSFQDKLV